MKTAKCPKCGNPNVGTIKDGSQFFLRKHNRSNGNMCDGSFSEVK